MGKMGVQTQIVTLITSWIGLKILIKLPNIFVRQNSKLYLYFPLFLGVLLRPQLIWILANMLLIIPFLASAEISLKEFTLCSVSRMPQ